MDDTSLLWRLGLLVVLILLSAFFSGSETALMALNKVRLKHLKKEGKKGAKLLDKIISRPDSLIGTILLGNNLVNVASSAIATSLAIYFFGPELGILYSTLIMTLVLLIFAEVTPKTYSAYHSEGVAFLVARPLALLMTLLKPLVLTVTFFTSGLLKIMGLKKEMGGDILTEDELKTMILLGEEAGHFGKKKTQMLQGILELRDISVKEVMVPRRDVFAIDMGTPLDEIKEAIIDSPYSRIPVYRGEIDKIEGVLYAKDFLKALAMGREFKLEDLVGAPYFVPETKKIQAQLADFQRNHVHLAIILDEFGGTEGIVTMEDLLEEIVGEIWDESDRELRPVTRYGDGSISVDGKLTIRELNKELDIDIPEEDFNTVAGLIMHRLGKVPEKGERHEYMGLKFTVQRMDGQAIIKIKIRKLQGQKQL